MNPKKGSKKKLPSAICGWLYYNEAAAGWFSVFSHKRMHLLSSAIELTFNDFLLFTNNILRVQHMHKVI
jgi:hypothetical protein